MRDHGYPDGDFRGERLAGLWLCHQLHHVHRSFHRGLRGDGVPRHGGGVGGQARGRADEIQLVSSRGHSSQQLLACCRTQQCGDDQRKRHRHGRCGSRSGRRQSGRPMPRNRHQGGQRREQPGHPQQPGDPLRPHRNLDHPGQHQRLSAQLLGRGKHPRTDRRRHRGQRVLEPLVQRDCSGGDPFSDLHDRRAALPRPCRDRKPVLRNRVHADSRCHDPTRDTICPQCD